ncbi:MAG: N-acetyltransferase family protein [Blastocatellales bacterium]
MNIQRRPSFDPPLFDPKDLERHQPDEHWLLTSSDREAIGHCSLWSRNVPVFPGHRLGLIGHYAARDGEAAQRLLSHACARLAASGCTLAVGPMDGSTWRRYRFISERGVEPSFFLEPDHPGDWLRQFHNEGFTTLAEYSSALNTDLRRQDERVARAAERLTDAGVSIRQLRPEDFEGELRRIYSVASISFARNFLYTPIVEAEFIAQHRMLQAYVRPELALIAEREDRTVGFLFALPDWSQAQRGQAINTVIIKTVAALPGREFAGLGNVLVARCHAVAGDLGYARAIHALMSEANNSRNLSGRYAQPMRRYVLLARRLK